MVSFHFQGRTCLAVVLTAGESSRFRSARPKVLHELGGRSMLTHVLSSLVDAGVERIVVVAGPNHDAVKVEARTIVGDAGIAIQNERLGTAHAVLAAREAIASGYDELLVVFADTPLVRSETFAALRKALAGGKIAVAALGFEAKQPAGYGRFILQDGTLKAIREDRDASAAEREIKLCNAGLMALDGRHALALIT
jgi:bifunctional UDP-N-acetylglucosamine pyrophosphorylase / glucosamine-1-phosphate N-acetyltransferase